ncbi:hypothetical protein [Xenorhabdus bovienii]|uniref:hypothetical protein n=1 Tax=Xenorhabdus bovienii TaxID=40576 RepID=UPI003DA566D9
MGNIIYSLWENEWLPIKDALYFLSGKALLLSINSYPKPNIQRRGWFDFSDYYKNNQEEITRIDIIKVVKLVNGFYCCIGEGSYGSEGFIACLDVKKN